MNILVTGANGQLGSEIREIHSNYEEYNFFFTDIDELDITDYGALEKFVLNYDVKLIINCAAYTAVDRAEEEREFALKINRDAVINLSRAISKTSGILIHISTDFVFDGNKNTPYKEDDFTNPISTYGISKLEGEKAALENARWVYIIRTSWLYSSYGKNFVKTILKAAKEKKHLNVVFDQVGTPTYARDLANTIMKLIRNLPTVNEKEIFHYSNEGVASWYDFAVAICELSGIDCEINPIETKDYPTPAKRPHYSVLDKSKIKKRLNINIPYWRNSLKECLNKLNY